MAQLDQEHWWFTARRRILANVIGRVVRPPHHARLLEVGCGTGHNLPMLAHFGDVEACELDDAARKLASERFGRAVREAKLPDLGMFPEAGYDVVALLDVLEHVPDDRPALDAILTRLKPGGALVLTVPANRWMWSAHDVAHHHFRRYSRRELERLALDAGYRIELLNYFNALLFPAVAVARILGKLSGKDAADDSMPPAVVNGLLDRIFGAEANLVGRMPMPFGVSLIAVLRRP